MATRSGWISCLDLVDGDSLWAVQAADAISATPALADGYLYFLGGADDRKLHCIEAADGDSVWATELGSSWDFGSGGRAPWMESSAAVVGDSVVFVGSRDGRAYCLYTDDGSIKWQSDPLGAYVVSSPAYAGGRIYIGSSEIPTNSDSSSVYCLNAQDGSIHWKYVYRNGNYGGTMSSATVDGDYIYIGINDCHNLECNGASIACLRTAYDDDENPPTGGLIVEPEWAVPIDCDVRGTPVVIDTLVYASTGKGLYAVSTDGDVIIANVEPGGNEELWSSLTASCRCTPAEQETLLFCGNGGFGDGTGFYALDLNLDTVWSHDTDCEVWGSAAIEAGRVVIAGNDGVVSCFVNDPNSERMIAPGNHLARDSEGSPAGAAVEVGAVPPQAVFGRVVAWPAPVTGRAFLSFEVPASSHQPVDLVVVDNMGRLVKTLAAAEILAGAQTACWDGTGNNGAAVPSGVYFFRLRAGGAEVSRSITLLR